MVLQRLLCVLLLLSLFTPTGIAHAAPSIADADAQLLLARNSDDDTGVTQDDPPEDDSEETEPVIGAPEPQLGWPNIAAMLTRLFGILR